MDSLNCPAVDLRRKMGLHSREMVEAFAKRFGMIAGDGVRANRFLGECKAAFPEIETGKVVVVCGAEG